MKSLLFGLSKVNWFTFVTAWAKSFFAFFCRIAYKKWSAVRSFSKIIKNCKLLATCKKAADNVGELFKQKNKALWLTFL
jgi:hypothetical protein